MALPKSAALKAQEDKGSEARNHGELLEKSNNVVGAVADQTTLPAVKCFNDFVAVLLTPRESCIALPGASEWSNIGVIVGIGPKCENPFVLGQNVVINPKGGGIAQVEEMGSEYEGKLVQLFSERNIFYAARTGPAVEVVCESTCEPGCGDCGSSDS